MSEQAPITTIRDQPAIGLAHHRTWATRMWLYLLIGVVSWVAVVWFGQRLILFPRWAMGPAGSSLPGPKVRCLQLETGRGPVEAWFLRGDQVSVQHPGPVVIFAHGNGELIDHWEHALCGYTDMGVSVLLVEYRGYGRSAGHPSQTAIVSDYRAFYALLGRREDVDADRIVLHGRSLGGGVVAQLAATASGLGDGVSDGGQLPAPAAMILQSSFIGTASLARSYLVPRFLVRDPFDVTTVLRQFTNPVLILHGTRDQVIPPRHARQNHMAAVNSRLIFYDISHNDPPPLQRYWTDIAEFLIAAGIISYNGSDLSQLRKDEGP